MEMGFIGLGSLGKAIAGRLIETGVKLSVWNRSKSKAADIAAAVAVSPGELISKNSIVALCLSESGAVREVLEGEKGLLSGDVSGKFIIDHTTNHFDAVAGFHNQVRKAGGFYLEAPVLGSVIPASKGLLTVLVSGEKEAYEKMFPYFEKMGKNIFYMGEAALATKMKLVNNLVLGNLMAVLAEAVAFGEACGVERAKVIEILSKGAGDSGVLNAKREKLLKEDFSPHFSSGMIHKDLHYLQDLARQMKRPLMTGSVIKEIFGMAIQDGLEKEDFSAVYKLFEE